jgi:16S rRNA (guanine(1405)-N(7))-methyltransferase
MALPAHATYHARDVDRRSLALVAAFLDLVGQPATVEERDLVADVPALPRADVALLLKLVPILDRQDPAATERLISALQARHAVVSFPARSLGGHRRGMAATYRHRLEALARSLGVTVAGEASVPNELVFVLALRG